MVLQREIVPSTAAPFVEPPAGLRFHRVATHSRKPDICPGDYVLIQPVTTYANEGEYLDDWGNISICQRIGGDLIRMKQTHLDGNVETLAIADFNERVVAKVVAVMKVLDRAAVRDMSGVYP